MEALPRCQQCGAGPATRVIGSLGGLADYVFFTCICGMEIYHARPVWSSEEGNWPDLLDGQEGRLCCSNHEMARSK